MSIIPKMQSQNIEITLKEITDLISVEHNKAMKVVEKLSQEPSFGEVEKFTTLNLNNVKVKTYKLNKKQAIAVGAKLNNSLLMKVIDRLEELESVNMRPLSVSEQIALIAQGHQEVDERLKKLEATKRLESWQERALQDAKNKKVYEIAKDDKELASKLHRKVWSIFKKAFHLPRYNELPAVKYEDGVRYIENLTLADMVA